MKRQTLIKHLKKHGCELFREGAKHSVYWNPDNRKTTAVPRHSEILNNLARKICEDLGIPTVS